MKLLLLATFASLASGFVSTTKSHSRDVKLHLDSSVIKGEELSAAPFDEGQGGVRLAEESAIKITGTVKHKPGKADPDISDLLRYNQVQETSEAAVKETGARIVATGRGTELYKDPGETIEEVVFFAPMEAAKDALNAAGSVKDSFRLVFNFLGGNDLQLLQVLDAMDFMITDALDLNTKCKVSFNSLAFKEFPNQQVTLTLVAYDEEIGGGAMSGIRAGEVYFRDGKWYTTTEEDINTAKA
mmetsp:Transcript_28844/g.52179  ORF Transcript_28844/g.52179 Transcript_28844/m.52179 type:complete len:242 (+) Transcript_28844:118-843(+)